MVEAYGFSITETDGDSIGVVSIAVKKMTTSELIQLLLPALAIIATVLRIVAYMVSASARTQKPKTRITISCAGPTRIYRTRQTETQQQDTYDFSDG